MNILLSTDGGHDVPDRAGREHAQRRLAVGRDAQRGTTTAARIKVEAVGNIFFDVSNANFTIDDPDAMPEVSIGNTTVTEGNTGTVTATFDVTLSATSAQTVTVGYATADGTAIAPADYVSKSGTVTFPPGTTTQPITVQVNGDTLDEPAETFRVDLSAPANATIDDGQGQATVTDDDVAGVIQLSSATYSVGEAAGLATITVTRAGGAASGVTVHYQTANGTAGPLDYTAASGTLTFAAGQSSLTFTVPIQNDPLDEPNETVMLSLSSPGGGAVLGGTTSATLTIVDDDVPGGPFGFSLAAYSAGEGSGSAVIAVTRTGSTTSAGAVSFATADGTAIAGADYTASSGMLTFGPGEKSKTFSVAISDDTAGEDDETVNLVLSAPFGGALGSRSKAVLTIKENEAVLQLSAPTFTIGESGPAAVITVTRTGMLTSSASVSYRTGNGTAQAGADYTAATGTLAFAPNIASRTFTVPVINDGIFEPTEAALLSLHSATGAGAAIGPRATSVLHITDNETLLQLSAATYTAAESAASALITVRRTGTPTGAVSVHYASENDTAFAGLDYSAVSGTLDFPSGVLTRTFTVPILNDTIGEAPERLRLRLSGAAGGAGVGPLDTALLTITDDEPRVQFSAAAYSVAEGTANATITVKRGPPTTGTVTVSYAASSGTATQGADFPPTAGVLDVRTRRGDEDLHRRHRQRRHPGRQRDGEPRPGSPQRRRPGHTRASRPHHRGQRDADVLQRRHLRRQGGHPHGDDHGQAQRSDGQHRASRLCGHQRNGRVTGGLRRDQRDVDLQPGQVAQTFTIPIVQDAVAEGNETVNLALTGTTVGAGLATPKTALLTITDDEPVVAFAAESYEVPESRPSVVLTLRRTGNTAATVSVPYSAGGGFATGGSDYGPVAGVLTFGPGAVTRTITVPIFNDTGDENVEDFTVTLGAPSGGALGVPAATKVKITDDDTSGLIQFERASFSTPEAAGTATITLVRSGGTAGAASVSYAASSDTATAGSDFPETSGVVAFAAGATRATFTLPITPDALEEGNEAVHLTLGGPSGGAALGPLTTATLWIVDAGAPGGRATLQVHTFRLDEGATDMMGAPAGAGVRILVDGVDFGPTGTDGTLTVDVPEGSRRIEALVPSVARAEKAVVLTAGESGEVSLVLDDGKDVVTATAMAVPEISEGILSAGFGSFTLRFFREGGTVPMVGIDTIEIQAQTSAGPVFIQDLFAIAGDGSIVATSAATLRSQLLIRASAPIEIRVQAYDADGVTHVGRVRFLLGSRQLAARLVAPPSAPGLDVSGIPVTFTMLGTGFEFRRLTDGSGRVTLPLLPVGNLAFQSETFQDGRWFYGEGTLFVTGNVGVRIVLRHETDAAGGVSAYVLEALARPSEDALAFAELGATERPAAERESRAAAEADLAARGGPPTLLQIPSGTPVTATSGAQDVAVTNSITFPVAKGTKKVTLVYNVYSAEYPFWVGLQSVYNDVWSVKVTGAASGKQLFTITRNVNSQAFTPPLWQADSTTGYIQEILDVESAAANQDITLTLRVSATNIGDSALATSVSALLSSEVGLVINSATPDAVNTTGDSSYYSVPRPGSTNTNARWFTLKITKPPSAALTRVTARLTAGGGGELMTVVDEAPGGASVQVVDDQTLRVRVTMHSPASSVGSQPPPAGDITYRFRIETAADFAERDSAVRRSLWRMPDGVARYGVRDAGGDDWASRGAYNWINGNGALITRVDDISGEHAINIGHDTHNRGTDIDMFHFYTFPGAGSGGDNYLRLRADVFAALGGNAAARARVVEWANDTRAGLDGLLPLGAVRQIFYAVGSGAQSGAPGAVVVLPYRWAETLLETGTLNAAGARP